MATTSDHIRAIAAELLLGKPSVDGITPAEKLFMLAASLESPLRAVVEEAKRRKAEAQLNPSAERVSLLQKTLEFERNMRALAESRAENLETVYLAAKDLLEEWDYGQDVSITSGDPSPVAVLRTALAVYAGDEE